MRKTRAETQVGALSGHDHGITEHGREAAFGSQYPICVPRSPTNVVRPLSGPLFDTEVRPKGCVIGGGFEILGPVKGGKNKGRYLLRSCPARIYLDKPKKKNVTLAIIGKRKRK
jgi:hypothetical protein